MTVPELTPQQSARQIAILIKQTKELLKIEGQIAISDETAMLVLIYRHLTPQHDRIASKLSEAIGKLGELLHKK